MAEKTYMIPTSVKEVKALGWDYIDVILFSGDAFIDHPSFGSAVIARWLQKFGYRVAVVPQPNWRDDLRDFRKLGPPRLYFGVNAGAMDSMVNHYTASKRLRSDDAYTPEARAGQRPDYAVTVYTRILKQIWPDVPVVIGGIEASLRRLTHYDYWQDALKPSVLVDSGADWLVYGMGERPILELTRAIENRRNLSEIRHIPQIGFWMDGKCPLQDAIYLNSFERCCKDKKAFAENFHVIETCANMMHAPVLVEPCGKGYVQINPPFPPATEEEMDSFWDLPFTKQPHPRYKGKHIPAFEMIKFSINTHRGCFGGCNFCTIAAHQGKFIQSRSEKSIIEEMEFDSILRSSGRKCELVPYFISGHPGCGMKEMKALSCNPALKGLYMDQVQDFTPTPMTTSSVMFYTGLDPRSMKKVFVERDIERKREQKSFFFRKGRH